MPPALRATLLMLAITMAAGAPEAAPAVTPSAQLQTIAEARRILEGPMDQRAIDLLDDISVADENVDEWLALLRSLLARPRGEDDTREIPITLAYLAGDARIVAWLDGDEADHALAIRLVPPLSRSAGDWMCRGLPSSHDTLHAALVRQLERRDGARREAVMDLLLELDCQLGAVAEPLLRMLGDASEDRRAFARRSLLRCKGGSAWLRGSLAGADDVLVASLADPVRRPLVLELLASGSCRQSPKLAAALEAELLHATDAERPQLEAAHAQVAPLAMTRSK